MYCDPGDPPYCGALIEYPIYVPAGSSQAAMAAELQTLSASQCLIPGACRMASLWVRRNGSLLHLR